MVVELLQSPMTRMSWRYPFVHPSETSLLIFGYVVFYLGLGKLLRAGSAFFARRDWARRRLARAVGACRMRHSRSDRRDRRPHLYHYSAKYITNPFLTIANEDRIFGMGWTSLELAIVVVAALGVFLLNVPGVLREIRQVRESKPPRVAEEDAALAKVKPALPRSPWNE